jgi:16S rRNA (guanine527-N7)-methyltransferase
VNRTGQGRPIGRHRARPATAPGAAPADGPRRRPDEAVARAPRAPLPTRVDGLPDLPDDAVAAFDAGLVALGLADDPVVERARTAILDHLRLLLAWSAAINLTSIRDPVAAVRLHVLDSLAAIPHLRLRGADRLVDLGTGGGFPGLPLALALPAREAVLVDSVAKKVGFVRAVVEATGAGATVRARVTRAEPLAAEPGRRERWPAVTARAVSSLVELAELSFPLLAPGGVLVAWKRGDPDDGPLAGEIATAGRALPVLGGGAIEVHPVPLADLAGHRLVIVTKGGRTPARFPRDPAARRRTPPA